MTPRLFALLLALPLLSGECAAQDYPAKTVKLIVPFGAGGPADVTARLIGNILQENFKQPVVVENRPGAGAVIGTVEVCAGGAGRLHPADNVQHPDRER